MSQIPPPCKCPECDASISLDHLKANLTDEALKSLWAALGGRNRTGRKITPKQQAAMQVTRAVNRLIRWCISHGGFVVTNTDPTLIVVAEAGPKGGVIGKRPRPAAPTPEDAEAFGEWVTATIEALSAFAKP